MLAQADALRRDLDLFVVVDELERILKRHLHGRRESDHTREHIPVIAYGAGLKPGSIGKRKSFADIGQTIASHFDLTPMDYGESFL